MLDLDRKITKLYHLQVALFFVEQVAFTIVILYNMNNNGPRGAVPP